MGIKSRIKLVRMFLRCAHSRHVLDQIALPISSENVIPALILDKITILSQFASLES